MSRADLAENSAVVVLAVLLPRPVANENSKELAPDAASWSPELQEIQEIYDLMVQENLDSVELQSPDTKIRLSRLSSAPPMVYHEAAAHHRGAAPRHKDVPAESSSVALTAITSPLAGVFYRASSPASPPFVKEGDVVSAGQTLCLVEAMKVMNEIKADKSCRITKIPAENSRPVTAGQPLFFIEPA